MNENSVLENHGISVRIVYVLDAVDCSLSEGSTCYIDKFPMAASMPPVDVMISFHYVSTNNIMF